VDDAHYSISEVSRCFHLPVSTVRYYDEIGLLPAPARKGSVRYYGRSDLRRLALINRLHRSGLVSLADTAHLIADSPAAAHPSGRELLTASIEALKARIRDLEAAQALLEHLLTCPTSDPVRECTHLRTELQKVVDDALGGSELPSGDSRRSPTEPFRPCPS
jgi:DNA-binding transcriptional MerR regulator